MKICDLHTHSIYSDGTLTPREIIQLAKQKGLSAVALTDHDTVYGLPEFLTAAEEYDIEAIPGVELSVDYKGHELHMLALFIPDDAFSMMSAFTKVIKTHKDKSHNDLISALNKAGYKIDGEKIKNSTPKGNFNRAHIAVELTKLGYTKSVKEAFETLLSPSAGYYVEPTRPDVFRVLTFIGEIGAVSVLAHPFLNLNEIVLEDFLPKAKAYGLVGMECFYSEYDEETTNKSIILADRYGLKYSGGSDFHGENKPSISLGTGKGNLKIPYETVLGFK